MRRTLIGVAFVLACALNCAAQESSCQRAMETAGGFSMCAPEGWTVETREGAKYKMLFGPHDTTFVPNINIKDEANPMSLADFVTAGIKSITESSEKLGATSIKLVDRSDFVTDSKLAGVRVSFSVLYKGMTIRSIQYIFNGKADQKLVVTGTSLEANKETTDPILDRAVKTFRLEP